MNFIRTAVKRRVTVAMCFLCVVLLGGVSFINIGLDLMPSIEMPMTMVMTTYDGAGSEEVESMVTEPLEEAFASLQNVDSISSQSSAGMSIVMVTYNYGTDLDFASLNMRERIDLIKDFLPEDAGTPTIYRMSMNSMPVMIATVSGSDNLASLKATVDNEIVPELESQDGVASVEVGGGFTESVSIEIDETVLENYGLTMSDISGAIQANNIDMAAGSVISNNKDMSIRVLGEYDSLADIENTNIVLPSGISVLLKDIADVSITTTADSDKVYQNGQEAVYISVTKASDANTAATCENLNNAMAELEETLPGNIEFTVVTDQGAYVEWTISGLVQSLLIGSFLAIAILLLFLRSFRSTLVIAVSIPISLISTFVLMYFTGMSLNIMTLGGLSLGAGMMVDASIVILENIQRYISNGMPREEAAVKGTRELILAVFSSTLTTVAVFLPVIFMEGITSMIFKDFALTIAFALMASLVVAVSLVPMMSSILLRPEDSQTEMLEQKEKNLYGKLKYYFAIGYEKLKAVYTDALDWSLEHRKRILGIVTAMFAAALVFVFIVGMEFLPASETGQLTVTVTMEEGLSDEAVNETAQEAENAILMACGDDLASTMVMIQDGSSSFMSSGDQTTIYVNLVEESERRLSAKEYGEEVREALSYIAGIEYNVAVGDMMTGSFAAMTSSIADVTVNVKGDDLDTIEDICNDLSAMMEDIPGAREIESSIEETIPELHITLNNNKVSAMGLTVPSVSSAINTYLSGITASTYAMEDGTEIDIDVNYSGDVNSTYNDLLNMPITTPTGATYLLTDVAEVEIGEGPVSITREDSKRLATVTCSLVNTDLDSFTTEFNKALNDYVIPEGYQVYSGGMWEEMMSSFTALGWGAVLGIILVYMVMAALFESFLQPFIILFTLPTAFIGVMFGIFITGSTLNVVSLIGIVMLIGIVVNNGIVLVDYVNTLRKEQPGISCKDALMIAGPLRLRPILMTALTTILGMIPMAVSQAAGADLSRGMAIAVSFGLTFSTFFTLFLVPVVYSLIDDYRVKRAATKAVMATAVAGNSNQDEAVMMDNQSEEPMMIDEETIEEKAELSEE